MRAFATLSSLAFGALFMTTQAQAITYDAFADFSAGANPNGAWSYSTDNAAYALNSHQNDLRVATWWTGMVIPQSITIGRNLTTNNVWWGTVLFRPNALMLDPESLGVKATLTISQAGAYNIVGSFLGSDSVGSLHAVSVLINGVAKFTDSIERLGDVKSFDLTKYWLNAGDTISFDVATGKYGGYAYLATGLTAQVSSVPGPLAGTGLPALLSLVGFGVWRRRRQAVV